MKKHIAGLGLVLIAMCAMPCVAATPSSGKIIVRVEDGAASRCINSATDKITMNLRRVVMEKKSGYFFGRQVCCTSVEYDAVRKRWAIRT